MAQVKYSLSVIIPVYNAEKYLKDCLDSIERQTYRDFEVVLVDDGSIDGSGLLCDSYVKRNQSWQVVHKKNGGVLDARNTGMQIAKGDYINFIDADDWVEADFLEVFMKHARHSGADMILGGCTRTVGGCDERLLNQFSEGTYEGESLAVLYEKMLCYREFFTFGILPYMCNKVFRRELLLSVLDEVDMRVYDGEDVIVNNLSMLKAKKIELIENCSYHYVLRESSVTVKKKADFYLNVSRLYLCLYKAFEESEHSDILLPQLDAYMRMMIWQGAPGKFVKERKYQFPFSDIRPNARIVLYAAGNVGRTFYEQIEMTGYCEIVAWVDKECQRLQSQGLDVQSVDILASLEYDQVILAVESEDVVKQIRKELVQYQIPEEKLVWGNYVLGETDSPVEKKGM